MKSTWMNLRGNSGRITFPVLLVLVISLFRAGQAAEVYWVGGSGDWNTAANWSGGVVPTAADDVTIDQPGDLQITITTLATANSLHSQEAIVLLRGQSGGRLTLASESAMPGGLTLSDSSTVIMGTGNLTVDGTFNWQGGFMTGPGKTALSATTITTLSGKQNPALFSRDLDNAGTINYFPQSKYGLELSSATPSLGSTFRNLPSGTLNLFSDATATTVIELGGSPSEIDNAGTFNKYGSGDFILEVALNNSGTINLITGKLILTVDCTNTGTINVPATAGLTVATYTNAGTVNVHENVSVLGPSVFTADVLNNAAAGHLNLLSGYSNLTGTINQSGEINVASGASATFNGVLNSSAGSKITGAGNIVFNTPIDNFAGTLQATGNVTVAKPIAFTANQTIAANLRLSADLAGPGNVSISGPLAWTDGVMSGSGKTTIVAGGSATIAPAAAASQIAPTLSRVLENAGTTNLLQTDAQGVALNFSGGAINNVAGGVFNIINTQTNGGFAGTGTLNNAGVVNVTAGSATFKFASVLLNNTGAVNLYSGGLTAALANSGDVNVYGATLKATGTNSGNINFAYNGDSSFNATSLINSGNFNVSSGALSILGARGLGGQVKVMARSSVSLDGSSGPAQNSTATITGSGSVTLTKFTQYPFAGSLQSTGDITISDTVNVATNQTIAGHLLLSNATLGGSGEITVTGSMDWSSGTIGGSGKLVIAPQSNLQFTNATGAKTLSRQLENHGSISITEASTDGNLFFSGGQLVNAENGILTITQGGAWIGGAFPTSSLFQNQGVLRLTNTTGVTFLLSVPSTNSGTIEIARNNTLKFQSTSSVQYIDAGGRIVLSEGTFSSTGPLVIQGGSIEGMGRVTATNVISHGIIDPAFSNLNSNSLTFSQLTLANDSQLKIDLGGTTPALNFDSILAMGSQNTLGGELLVRFVNGFQNSIKATDTFRILLSTATLTGAFLNAANGQRFLTADGLGSFVAHYGTGSSLIPTHVILSDYLPYVPGDFNADGHVDASDFVAWQAHFPLNSGVTLAMGDGDGDGDVDGADFIAWQTSAATGAAQVAVPEPATGCLALLMLVGMGLGQRYFSTTGAGKSR